MQKVLHLSLRMQMVRLSFFIWLWFFKDYKTEVSSPKSFKSQLCGTLKNPHTIRKKSDTDFPVLWSGL